MKTGRMNKVPGLNRENRFFSVSRRELSGLLLSALICQIFILVPCLAAEKNKAPKMSVAVQNAVYDAQQKIKKKEYAGAGRRLLKYMEKHPHKPSYIVEFTLGTILTLEGKSNEALKHYQASAKLYSGYVPTWQNMGKVYFDIKKYEPAGDSLLKAYETGKKKESSALYNVAVCYIMAGREEKALPHLEHIVSGINKAPKAEWLEALLKVCVDLKLKKKGFEVINRLLDKDENDPRWWKILAQFYLQQNDYKNGLAAMTIYSYLTSINREDTILLGDLSSVVGTPLKAAEYFDKALSLSNNPADYKKTASAYLAAHRPEKAVDILTLAIKKKPTHGLWFMMGQVFYQQERFDNAYNAFAQSAGLDAANGRSYLLMGYSALNMNKNGAAKKAFEKAAGFPKQRKAAKKALRHICSSECSRNVEIR